MLNSRGRRRFGCHRRALRPVRVSICIQAVSSTASATMARQIWFCAKSCRGRLVNLCLRRCGCRPRSVDLLLGAVDYLTATTRAITLDLTGVTAVDAAAVRALFTARYNALTAGAVLDLVIPAHLQRRLAVCRPLVVTPGGYRNPPPQMSIRSTGAGGTGQ